jgi:hypothetical protein
VNDVPVVHHLDAAAVTRCAATWQRQHQALSDEAVQPVIPRVRQQAGPRTGSNPQVQPIADQAGRHRVEYLAEDKSAAGGHPHFGLVMVGGASRRQSAQLGTFQANQLLASGVTATDEVGDPVSIGIEAIEVGAAAEQQGLGDDTLEVAMLAFDRAVFVRDTPIVAGRLHAVVGAECFVATGLILGGVPIEVAECR